MGPIGVQEMVAVFVIALILFGPKKLPELGRIIGKGLSEFRRAKSELKATFETHLNELERETRVTTTPTPAITDQSSSHYSYPYDEYGGAYGSGTAHEIAPPASSASVETLEQPAPPTPAVYREESVAHVVPVPEEEHRS